MNTTAERTSIVTILRLEFVWNVSGKIEIFAKPSSSLTNIPICFLKESAVLKLNNFKSDFGEALKRDYANTCLPSLWPWSHLATHEYNAMDFVSQANKL